MNKFETSEEIMGYHCSAHFQNGVYQLCLPEWSGRQTDVAQLDNLIRFLQAFRDAIPPEAPDKITSYNCTS